MGLVKSGIIGCALMATAAAGALGRNAWAAQAVEERPWVAGECYRVSFLDPAQQQTLRVLENPAGAWVRVQSDPRSPRVPGASPRGRVWLNTAAVFAVAEIECSTIPGI